MKPRAQNENQSRVEQREPKYRDVDWPQRGRFMFGPWCLLGAWPAVFGMVEEAKEDANGSRSDRH
jgi:hypothetical protein